MLDSAHVVTTGNNVIQVIQWVWPMIVTLIGIILHHKTLTTPVKSDKQK
jgi:hypothetical protein